MSEEFKARPVHLTPISLSLLFGILCTYLILLSPTEHYNVAPLPEGLFGAFGNACYFVILVGVGATLLYLLLKNKNHKMITIITAFALTTAIFTLSFIYLFAAFSLFPFPFMEFVALILSASITALADFAMFKIRSRICSLIVISLGGALGAFLGASIPTLSTIFILCFLVIYDMFAVYHGPVGKIARNGLEKLHGLSFSFKNIQMGLGDLTFYSMLSGHMFINFGFLSCSASVIGILVGCFLSFKMLEKKGMLPGLPFPIILGLTLSLLVTLLI